MAELADAVSGYGLMSGEIERPVVDRTGLN
jgi:hypothetical protein